MNHKTKYWVITASKDHVNRGETGGFAQACHGKATPLKKMKPNDYIIYYSSKLYFNKKEKCQAFTAIGRVEDDEIYQVELSTDFCPYRININFFESNDVSIYPLIDKLDFIPNKQKWGYPFRWGILEINEHDFELISNQMLNEHEN